MNVKKLREVWRTVIGAWYCDHCGRYHSALVERYEFDGIDSMDSCGRGLWDMAENIASEYGDLRVEEIALDLMREQVGCVARAGRDVTARRLRAIQRAATGHAV